IYRGSGARLDRLWSQPHPHSLGLFYAAFTAWAGFAVNSGEQMLMGLAAYGRDRHRDAVDRVLCTASDGTFTLDVRYVDAIGLTPLAFTPHLERDFGPRRPPGKRWQLDDEGDRHTADVACSVQHALEDALLGLARRAKQLTSADRLCLAGGVALNAVANARLAKEAGFTEVFVHPAAGDAGGALGAALIGAAEAGDDVHGRA